MITYLRCRVLAFCVWKAVFSAVARISAFVIDFNGEFRTSGVLPDAIPDAELDICSMEARIRPCMMHRSRPRVFWRQFAKFHSNHFTFWKLGSKNCTFGSWTIIGSGLPATDVITVCDRRAFCENYWRNLRAEKNKKLSCRRETARRFVSLNILLSDSRSFEMTLLSRACVSPY